MKNQKSLTNKGFSLVELIIVVAIMAILIGVLAPQYLRYVEKSRLQKDNSAMGEIANVLKAASAEEEVIKALNTAGGTATYTFDNASGALKKSSVVALDDELDVTVTIADVALTSSTYKNANYNVEIEVTLDTSTNIVTVTANNWKSTPSDTTGSTKTF